MSSPSSIVHYTSVEVVNILLNEALSSKDGQMTLHLSLLTMMNDKGEMSYVLDKYFTDSALKREKKHAWDTEFLPAHQPFIFSTSATDVNTKENGSLPMWKMYGDDCKGAYIRFNGEAVGDFCKKHGLIFERCEYRTIREVGERIKKFNHDNTSFEEILKEACLTKSIAWNYEQEYRIICLTNQESVKTKAIPKFIELKIPIDLIEEICLGPLADAHTSLESLSLLRDKLKVKFREKAHFKIRQSKISII